MSRYKKKPIADYLGQRVVLDGSDDLVELSTVSPADLARAQLASIKTGSMWRPRNPGDRGELLAMVTRLCRGEDKPVVYLTGGQKFTDTRKDFLARYITHGEWLRLDAERRSARAKAGAA